MKFYQLEEWDINCLRSIAKRLYSEDRMNGDEMRDAAQTIDGVIRRSEEMSFDTEEYELRSIEEQTIARRDFLKEVGTPELSKEERAKLLAEHNGDVLYGVFDNGKPASRGGYPMLERDCWATHLFPTFELACEYARDWLGEFGTVSKLLLDTPIDYSGYGDVIEIRSLKREDK